jgi:hypothetical protein
MHQIPTKQKASLSLLKSAMKSNPTIAPEKNKSVHALEATNLFLADVQTGLGPLLGPNNNGRKW